MSGFAPPGRNSPPHLVIDINDEALGRLGQIVIDRPWRGSAFGALLFASDVSQAELADLARVMTYKWAFLNIPMGGAMGSILAVPQQLGCDRATVLEAFGRSIAPLVRRQIFYPGCDVNVTPDDLHVIMRAAGQPLSGQQIDSALTTSLTVFEAIRQAARFNGLTLAGLRVALEGFGKVGSVLAQLLHQTGAKLVALSTSKGGVVNQEGLDVPRLLSLRRQHSGRLFEYYSESQRIPPETIFTQAVDVLIPGARAHTIHAGNADQILARIIVSLANAAVTPEAEQTLAARGVTLLPDFVANCGGVLAVDARGAGFDLDEVRQIVETVYAGTVVSLLQRARQEGRSAGEVAREMAWQNHRESSGQAPASPGKAGRALVMLKNGDWRGLWRRVAWRVYQRWPGLKGVTRRAALERFIEFRLGTTLERIVALDRESVAQIPA